MNALHQIYNKKGYFKTHATDVLISVSIIVTCIAFVTRATYKDLIVSVQHDWANQRCNPIYMPFAGVIMPVDGQTAMKTTSNNFDYCAQHDISAMLKTALMPLEYISFVIIRSIDILVHAIVACMAFLAYLKSKMSGMFGMTFMKIADIMVPITIFIVRARDNLAKMNAVMVTSLFTTLVVYKITVSGMINVMTILLNLMLALIGVLVGMFILAAILLFNPFTTIAGVILAAATVAIIAAVLIPAIALYSSMHKFMANTFGVSSTTPPAIPSLQKKKKK